MAVTIKDVAKLAGVSISTVSKVINESPTISAATKERVKKIMDELNYYPNIIARSFAQQNSYTIGAIMELKRSYAFVSSHIYEILGGIEEVVNQNGYLLTLTNANSVFSNNDSFERIIIQKRVDGLIIQVSAINKSICKRMDDLGFPYIIIGQPSFESNACWIDINNKMAGEIATNHLIEEGYTKIAFIGGVSRDNINSTRQAGYKNALLRKNIRLEKQYVKEIEISVENSFHFMNELLELPEPPDSVVCSSNFVAFGAMKAIKAKGLRIPEDVALVTFDNYPLSQFTDPQLSVVDIDVFELGTHAASALMNKLKNPNLQIQYSMLSPTLIIRESSRKVGQAT